MRLKEIKPGMVIHCKTKEEMEQLLKRIKFFNTVDNIWNYGNDGVNRDCIRINEMGQYEGFSTYDYYANEMRYKITEFSDLILPEMTDEEVLDILSEIRNRKGRDCDDCPFSEKYNGTCRQWKSDHSKKEPEIETVDICRIIEIQTDGRKRCVHEETIKKPITLEVEETLKRYCMEHDGEFIAVHEVVSRVKR